MFLLLPLLLGATLRDAQQAFAAGDCVRAQAALREVIAADPRNYAAHVMSGHCSIRQKQYGAAIRQFRRAMELRPEMPSGLLGLIQAYALSGDRMHRDAEIERLRALIGAGKVSTTLRFVREQFTAGGKRVVVSEYPYLSLLRSRYLFEVFDAQDKPVQRLELVSREAEHRFSLISGDATVRIYGGREPAYEQVIADVKAVLAGRPSSTGDYAVAKTPAVVVPFPITVDDSTDARLALQPGRVAIEYIAHSCFRIHTASGARILIDPFASRTWIGYDFPAKLAADAVLITHPHYDHDADVLIGGQPSPWTPDVRVLRDPGTYALSGVTVTGILGKHAEPWGEEFGRTNTIWLVEVDGLRIAHLGDNGPLSEATLKELGRVDVLMIPIDAKHHILKDPEVEAIRKALHPRVLIPMHYRLPDLEASADSPEDLGEITPWLTRTNVVQLESNLAIFSAADLLPAQVVMVFPHSTRVTAAPH
jgi:L-ascorbate metabolism protein UlaG (beta-lactamase superfamily)